jgi:hypothetical protein
MVNFQIEIVINKNIKEVSDFSGNPNNSMDWLSNVLSIQWKTPKPVQLNSKIAVKSKFVGREFFHIYEVVFIEENKKMMMKTKDGALPMMTTYHWIEIDENTTLFKIDVKGNPVRIYKFLSTCIQFSMKRAYQRGLTRLKEILEK